jgi:hypothetical protein
MARQAPAPIWLRIRASRYLLLYLLAVHGLAGLACWRVPLPPLWRATALLLLMASLGWYLRVYVWRQGAAAVTAAHWQADGSWMVTDGRGRASHCPRYEVTLDGPLLIVVRLYGKSHNRWLVLARDSADAEALRQLRVRLRRRNLEAPAQDGPLTGR